ncbi:4'-phosphopantetheinyl transferase family protein [Streptomyces sp. GS7]|uniref:4'-phosphopantetheinyl transferase family protein n=1 Tax=Streptomyces sp. GS7 TaxID=2692234 RepID=UPI001F3257B1|nr:4'-phosphopantetheinyl transferase superfamily protein [Streptomyces sp. GS7]
MRLHSWEDDPGDLRAVLSPEERARADSFVFPRHRRQYVISHAFVRQVLSWYVPVRPRDLRFGTGPHGKPRLDRPAGAPGLEFNLSHCAELALVGIAREAIGVDVEAVRHGHDATGVAHYFHPAERRVLDGLPADRRSGAFHRGWTRKEAVVKAIGAGLTIPLDAFEVELDTDAPTVPRARGPAFPTGRSWHLTHLEPLPGYVGAVAVPFRPATIAAALVTGPVLPPTRAPGAGIPAVQDGWASPYESPTGR